MSFDTDVVVIGAGVIGLACARALARDGKEVLLIERNSRHGTETSSRNSEVIHAGIYYRPNSLKAKLCVAGKRMLYEFCESFGVAYRKCGKLIVATSAEQENVLETIYENALNNGVEDMSRVSKAEAFAMESEVSCYSALHSASSGIVDGQGLMLALLGDFERHGGLLAVNSPVDRVIATGSGFDIFTGGAEPTMVRTKHLINTAGLSASLVASRIEGLRPEYIPHTYFAKGTYFSLSGKSPFSRLVYPVPEPGGLGVHFTLDFGGQGRFGPDVEWVDAINYTLNAERGAGFYSAIRRYWPALPDHSLSPAYAGIRPKVAGPGESDADFLIQDFHSHGVEGLVNLFGIESPGLTSGLAIAQKIALSLV